MTINKNERSYIKQFGRVANRSHKPQLDQSMMAMRSLVKSRPFGVSWDHVGFLLVSCSIVREPLDWTMTRGWTLTNGLTPNDWSITVTSHLEPIWSLC